MAKFSTEEVCKISRHKRASTVERNYNIGLHSDQRADMAAAIAQAPLLKRGHEFQTVSEHLPRKTSVGQVQMAKSVDWIPTGDDMVQKEDTMEEMFPKVEDEAEFFVDEVPLVSMQVVVEGKDCSSLNYSQEVNFGEVAQEVDIERANDTMKEMFPKVENEAQLFVDKVPVDGMQGVVEEKDCSSMKHSQVENFGEVAQDVDIERANDR
jgi:hypothetical protein